MKGGRGVWRFGCQGGVWSASSLQGGDGGACKVLREIVGSGPDWIFDIDALTRTMNYEPIVAGTQSNGFAESHDDGSKPSSDDGKKVDEDPRKDSECNDQEKEDNVNAASIYKVNGVGGKTRIELPFDPNMPALEDYRHI
ncbi:hypothetical protein Tco_1024008 [Tanacetum coccineum]